LRGGDICSRTDIVVKPRSIERDAVRLRACDERSIDQRSTQRSVPPLMAERTNVRLQLANRPENVMLVREVLSGVADALALDGGDLIDIHTAVTEACNNVVQHAYDGEEGPLDVVVELAPGAVTVVVRDWGRGIPSHDGGVPEEDPGIGLPVIRALAHRLELCRPADGGTEVWMDFPITPKVCVPKPPALREAALPAIAPTVHPRTIALTTVPGDLARTVLPRLMCGLAARAHFSTDRLCDVHLLGDAIGASDGASLQIAAGVEPRALELRIGPLEQGRAQQLIADASLEGLGSVIAKLVDRLRVESAGSYELLALRLTDGRGRARDVGAARR
jgi:serine/threonine-protein kinase RsbW